MNVRRGLPVAAVLVALALVASATGCTSRSAAADTRLQVVAAYYPLQFAASEIGGVDVSVSSLTRPGGEPHDLELTPRDVVVMRKAAVVVYQSGFQPAVDDAVAQVPSASALDVASAANLVPAQGASADSHPGEEAATTPGLDPHFWLDPIRYTHVGTAIGERLATLDPAHARGYRARGEVFSRRLEALDRDFAAGLAHCRNRDLVTAHAAFGYLAARYGFTQRSVTGLSPETEPSAAGLRDLVDHVRETGATTVYAEPLVSPALARTVARETGARVAVLDPVEGVTKDSAAPDYFGIMRANLATLEKGQGCA